MRGLEKTCKLRRKDVFYLQILRDQWGRKKAGKWGIPFFYLDSISSCLSVRRVKRRREKKDREKKGKGRRVLRGDETMRRLQVFQLCFILLCLFSFFPGEAGVPAHRVKRILMIDSYGESDLWSGNLKRAFQNYLNGEHLPLNYENYELGVRYQPGIRPDEADVIGLQAKLSSKGYDLIVVSNNDATDLFLNGRLIPRADTPILSLAYQGNLRKRIPAELNMTGVETPLNMPENALLGMELLPSVRRIVFITGASADGRKQETILQKIFSRIIRDHELFYLSGSEYTTQEMLDRLNSFSPEDTFLLYHSWSSSREEEPENSYTVLPRIAERFQGLILGKYRCYTALGATGGIVASGRVQGRIGGEMGLRILQGEKAREIPVVKAESLAEFDYSALKRCGFSPSQVKELPILRERTVKFWKVPAGFIARNMENLTYLAVFVLCFCFFVIGTLLYREKTERRIRLIFEHLPLGIGVADSAGRMLFSHAQEDTASVYRKLSHIDGLPPELRKLFPEALARVFATGEDQELDYEFSGRFRHAGFLRLPAGSQFGPNAAMWYSTDVTELRQAHAEAAEIAERFRLTLESIGDGVIATDASERITLVNPVACRFMGISREEAEGRILKDVFHLVRHYSASSAPAAERLENEVDSPLREALFSGKTVELTEHLILISADGTHRHIAASAAPIRLADGGIAGGVLVFRDVTEEYEKRDQLRKNSIILKNMEKLAQIVCFSFREDGPFTMSSENMGAFWPEKDGRPLPPEEWIAPEDLPRFQSEWSGIRSGKISELNVLFSVNTPSGKRYFEIRMERSDDHSGEGREFCGVIQDITRARENEIRYRDNLNLLGSIMNNLPGYLFVKNADDHFRYVMCNHGFENLIGVKSERIIGRFDRDIFTLDDEAAEKFRRDDLNLLESGGTMDMREFLTNENNQKLVVRTIKNVIRQSNGTRLLIGMGIDISDQYALEEQQKQTIRRLNDFSRSERIFNESLTRITLENDFNRAVNDMLRIIGENVGADRCYLVRLRDENSNPVDCEFEWVRDSAAASSPLQQTSQEQPSQPPKYSSGPPEKSEVENEKPGNREEEKKKTAPLSPSPDMVSAGSPLLLCCSTFPPEWEHVLRTRKYLILSDMDTVPKELEAVAESLRKRGIRSLLLSGFPAQGDVQGVVGMEFVHAGREFSDCDVLMLHSIFNLFLLARERQRQIARIEDSVALQRQIVNSISIPITILDPGYGIIAANPSALKETGRNLDEIRGEKCYSVFCRAPEPPDWCPMRLALKTGRMQSAEHEFFKGRRFLSTAQPLLDRQGRISSVLVSDVDITEITRQKQELQKAMELAQAADRAKSYFIATVSHELRTPLNAVIGFSELLQSGVVDREEQEEYLRSINMAGNALLNLVNGVLDLSSLEAGQLNMLPVRTDMTELVKEAVSVFKLKAKEKNLAIRSHVSGLERPLYVDHLRLRQVVFNLLGNAVKFTPSGEVSLSVFFCPRPGRASGILSIQVSDTGIGISPEYVRKIFDPFVREENSARGNHIYEGSGLGLAICRRLVDRMGGTIHLESTPGEGSVFTVVLEDVAYDSGNDSPPEERQLAEGTDPVKFLPEERKGGKTPDGGPVREGALRNRENPPGKTASGDSARAPIRMLLVDDVPMNLKLLQAILNRLNVECTLAYSGPEALRLLKERQLRFDAVLTDIWMPGMSGAELAGQILSDPGITLPVIAVTADAEALSEQEKVFDAILLKPITAASLEKMIREVLLPGKKSSSSAPG